MPLERLGNGGWVATGPAIDLVRLVALKHRLKLEILGIRFKGPTTSTVLRREFGWHERSRDDLLQHLIAHIAAVREEKLQ